MLKLVNHLSRNGDFNEAKQRLITILNGASILSSIIPRSSSNTLGSNPCTLLTTNGEALKAVCEDDPTNDGIIWRCPNPECEWELDENPCRECGVHVDESSFVAWQYDSTEYVEYEDEKEEDEAEEDDSETDDETDDDDGCDNDGEDCMEDCVEAGGEGSSEQTQ